MDYIPASSFIELVYLGYLLIKECCLNNGFLNTTFNEQFLLDLYLFIEYRSFFKSLVLLLERSPSGSTFRNDCWVGTVGYSVSRPTVITRIIICFGRPSLSTFDDGETQVR